MYISGRIVGQQGLMPMALACRKGEWKKSGISSTVAVLPWKIDCILTLVGIVVATSKNFNFSFETLIVTMRYLRESFMLEKI